MKLTNKSNYLARLLYLKRTNNITTVNRGVTLLEIMVAVFILALSLIPVFGVLTGSVKNTDASLTRSFAVAYAKSVLNTVLDNVAFADIKQGAPAIISGASTNMAKNLFPGASSASGGIACSGIATDSRGVYYQIYLRSTAINDTSNGYTPGEFYFSYYPNPAVESQPGWDKLQKLATKTEGLNSLPSKFTNASGLLSPYRYYGPTVTSNRWGPAEEAAGNVIHRDQREVSEPDASGKYCLLQKLVLQIKWNADSQYYKTPSTNKGKPIKLQIITYKANLDL